MVSSLNDANNTVIYFPRYAPSNGSDMKMYPAFPAVWKFCADLIIHIFHEMGVSGGDSPPRKFYAKLDNFSRKKLKKTVAFCDEIHRNEVFLRWDSSKHPKKFRQNEKIFNGKKKRKFVAFRLIARKNIEIFARLAMKLIGTKLLKVRCSYVSQYYSPDLPCKNYSTKDLIIKNSKNCRPSDKLIAVTP